MDLFNPGQVFACIGFAEAAQVLLGDVAGAFDWSEPAQPRFWLESLSDESPFEEILSFCCDAEVYSLGTGEGMNTDRWNVPTVRNGNVDTFPVRPPSTPATLPALMRTSDQELRFDHWADATVRDNAKFWAGAGGYPGAALLRDALALVRHRLPEAAGDPFAVSAPQTSSFRLDWRRDYVPLDAGFSLNEHGNVVPRGYPLVEILAALGLSHARPQRETKLRYRYGVITSPNDRLIPLPFLRAALGGGRELPFPQRSFRMDLDWPGQENQARCITTVLEETNHEN